jgi:hypothetical protein
MRLNIPRMRSVCDVTSGLLPVNFRRGFQENGANKAETHHERAVNENTGLAFSRKKSFSLNLKMI